MLKAILLVLEPTAAWEKIFLARRGTVFVLLSHLLPLLLIGSVCEGYGLIHWGKQRGQMQDVVHIKTFSRAETVIFETAQLIVSLLVVFGGANMVKSIGETFHGRHNYNQAFSAIAYGLSPLFALRLLDAFPSVSPWVTWSIGIMLSIGALYHGVPRMMEPDPPHAFGLFLMASLLLLVITGMVRFVTWWYLTGKLPQVDSFVSGLAARLPFL
ncbi:MAG: YIP1 family protein [Verrucomicrobiota bacterium]|nr:YIP1 family protein [Verrucomicrobiota bacterium]